MGKLKKITFPTGFVLEPGRGYRIASYDRLKACMARYGKSLRYGDGFVEPMKAKCGKKLVLHFIERRGERVPGAKYNLIFSADHSDSFSWNEWMLDEYWDWVERSGKNPFAGDSDECDEPVCVADPRPEPRPFRPAPAPAPRPEPRPVYDEPVLSRPKKSNGNKMLKMLLLMSMMQKPAAKPEAEKPKAK